MKKHLITVATAVTLALPALSQAAPLRQGGYVSGFLGVSAPRNSETNGIDFFNSNGASFNEQVDFDPGIYVGGTGGYNFGFFRLEGELSYRHAEINSISNGTFRNPDGNLGALAVMGNAFFDLRNSTPVTPYWGGGVGFASLHLSDTYGTDSLGRTLVYAGDTDTVFAYQAGAGLEIALNRQLSLDLGYRYFGTSTARFGANKDITTDLKLESHNGAVGLRVKF